MLPGVVPGAVAEVTTRTGEPGLRARKKQQARERIVEAALDLFARQGFEGTTVAQVAAAAEVSPATVARYFPAKEGLLFSDRDQHIEELRRSIAERPGREAPATAVIAALRAQPPLDAESRRRLLHSRQAIARSSVLRGSANALLAAWRDAIAEAAQARGAAELDARVLAVSVVAVLDDTSERWAAAGGRDDLQTMIAEAFTALRRTRS